MDQNKLRFSYHDAEGQICNNLAEALNGQILCMERAKDILCAFVYARVSGGGSAHDSRRWFVWRTAPICRGGLQNLRPALEMRTCTAHICQATCAGFCGRVWLKYHSLVCTSFRFRARG